MEHRKKNAGKTTDDLILDSFQFYVGDGSHNKRKFFNNNCAGVQPKPPFFRETDFFEPEMETHNEAF